ncbi:hypothetical protein GCM10020254_73890 [Streptomyces goshikiensis]
MTVPKTSFLVLDCAEPEALARFYAEFLDAAAGRSSADPDLFLVTSATGVLVGIRRDPGQAPPSWPRPEDSQQAHLHVLVAPDRLDQAEREAVALGARPVGGPGRTAPGWTTVRTCAGSPTPPATPSSSFPPRRDPASAPCEAGGGAPGGAAAPDGLPWGRQQLERPCPSTRLPRIAAFRRRPGGSRPSAGCAARSAVRGPGAAGVTYGNWICGSARSGSPRSGS